MPSLTGLGMPLPQEPSTPNPVWLERGTLLDLFALYGQLHDHRPMGNPELIILMILIICHFIGGIASFGSALLSVPLMLLWWGHAGLEKAVLMVLALGFTQAVVLVWQTWRDLTLKQLWPFYLCALIGLPIGTYMVNVLPRTPMVILLIVLILFAAVQSLYGTLQCKGKHEDDAPAEPPAGWRGYASWVLALFGGSIHGAFGIGGSVLVVAMRLQHEDKSAFRAGMAMLWVILAALYLSMVLAKGEGLHQQGWNLLIAIPCVLLVTWLGDLVAKKLRGDFFTYLVACLLLISAGSLAWSLF